MVLGFDGMGWGFGSLEERLDFGGGGGFWDM